MNKLNSLEEYGIAIEDRIFSLFPTQSGLSFRIGKEEDGQETLRMILNGGTYRIGNPHTLLRYLTPPYAIPEIEQAIAVKSFYAFITTLLQLCILWQIPSNQD